MSAFVAVETLVAVEDTGKMTRALAIQITGGLSNPSKMPGAAWGTSAWDCETGSKLAEIEGSVCRDCYAREHAYAWPNVRAAYERRGERISHPRWVEAMVFLISRTLEYFRLKDSGDLASVEELRKIVQVCVALPEKKFWLPTREYRIVQLFLNSGGVIPDNLVIRLSAHMMDASAPSGYGLPTSTVHTSEDKEPADTHICRAYEVDKRGKVKVTSCNKAGNCRACWDPNVANVSYFAH